MPRKYRHIKDDEKKLIEHKTGNRLLFYAVFKPKQNGLRLKSEIRLLLKI